MRMARRELFSRGSRLSRPVLAQRGGSKREGPHTSSHKQPPPPAHAPTLGCAEHVHTKWWYLHTKGWGLHTKGFGGSRLHRGAVPVPSSKWLLDHGAASACVCLRRHQRTRHPFERLTRCGVASSTATESPTCEASAITMNTQLEGLMRNKCLTHTLGALSNQCTHPSW